MSVNSDYVFNVLLFCIENWKKIRYKNLKGGKSLLSRYDLMIKIFPKKYSSLIHKSQADECFFKYRPRIINMSSDYIEKNLIKRFFHKMKALITGITGMVGSHLLDYLHKKILI